MLVVYQGANGALVGRYWDQHEWQWNPHRAPHGFPPGTQMASAPAAFNWIEQTGDNEDVGSTRQNVFFQGADGSFVEAYWDPSSVEGDWFWNNHGRPPDTRMASAPTAVTWVLRTEDCLKQDPGPPPYS
jgi:hypothetical protein